MTRVQLPPALLPRLALMLALLTPVASAAGGAQPSAPALELQQRMRQASMPMDDRLARLSGRAFDRSYLSMMIAHHQAAVASSEAVLKRTRTPQIRRWAESIIAHQQAEIRQMQGLLRGYGGPDRMQGMMRQMMNRMDMAGRVAASANPDRTYLEGMIPHHAGANVTSTLALQRTETPAVLTLAQDIVTAQAREMHEFQDWLRTHR